MTLGTKLVARIALFSALVYVLSWATIYLLNVNLIFFIVFSAGFLWGLFPGVIVGLVGMGLWSAFNPYGPAHPYVMIAQMIGAALSGLVGAAFQRINWEHTGSGRLYTYLVTSAVLCTVLFYIPVNLVDAWLIQPFWPRFVSSAVWSLISLVSNMVIFPLLFGVTRHLYVRERKILWEST
jgi:uncharacterized membrane protein